jgi:uncharacterized RDD family membrane protein YckC
MRQGQTILLLLTAIFLLTEIIFNYIVLTNGDGDLFGASIKTFIFLLFILLFSKKQSWAKWILSISLILYGLLCLLVGFELTAIFYVIGLYDIFFGFYIHKSQTLRIFRNDIISSQVIEIEVSPDANNFTSEDPNLYPSLVRRYKALFIDSVLILTTLVTIMVLVQDSDFRATIMVSAASIILLTYEPFLTSFSKTVGQRLMKIRVGKRKNPSERINLLNAYIRWFTKGLLGWISFLTIHFNRQRRAIHDMASDSVVISDE